MHGTTPETTSLPGLVWAEAAAHAAAATATARRRTAALGAIALAGSELECGARDGFGCL